MRRAMAVCATGWLLAFLVPAALGDEEEAAKARVRDGVDLSQRLSSGPIVILGRVLESSLKAKVRVERTYRTTHELPQPLRIAYRSDNVARDPGEPRFEPLDHERAVFVLERWTDYYGELGDDDLYRPSAGYRSRIPLPAEGAQALLEAIEEIVRFKDAEDRERAEEELLGWLQARNPFLIDVALAHVATHGPPDRRCLRDLVEHTQSASPERRKLAVQALGVGLARGRIGEAADRPSGVPQREPGSQTAADDRELCREALIQVARTDQEPTVRRTAVRALGRSGLEDIAPVLETIAERDDDQNVRYEAETLLLRKRDEALR